MKLLKLMKLQPKNTKTHGKIKSRKGLFLFRIFYIPFYAIIFKGDVNYAKHFDRTI